jgi:hypothetical protein
MSKMPKIEVSCLFYKEKSYICNYIYLLISYFSCCKYQTIIIKTEQSDTIILVRQFLGGLDTLAHFRHFRHFSGLSGLGIYYIDRFSTNQTFSDNLMCKIFTNFP